MTKEEFIRLQAKHVFEYNLALTNVSKLENELEEAKQTLEDAKASYHFTSCTYDEYINGTLEE